MESNPRKMKPSEYKTLWFVWSHNLPTYDVPFVDTIYPATSGYVQQILLQNGIQTSVYHANTVPIDANRNKAIDTCMKGLPVYKEYVIWPDGRREYKTQDEMRDLIDRGKIKREQIETTDEIAERTMKADYIFFFDTDMTFPHDTVLTMVNEMLVKDLDILTGCYYRKGGGHTPVQGIYINDWTAKGLSIYKYDEYSNKDKCKMLDQWVVGWEPMDGQIYEVDCYGVGCLLLNTRIFEDRGGPVKRPYFKYIDTPGYHGSGAIEDGEPLYRSTSEDMWFCAQVKEAGIQAYAHPKIQCGHLTKMTVTQDVWRNQLKYYMNRPETDAHKNMSNLYNDLRKRYGDRIGKSWGDVLSSWENDRARKEVASKQGAKRERVTD